MTFVQSTFFSQSLGMHVSCDVLLPHQPAGENGYRVLWLLHPALSDRSEWIARTQIASLAESAHLAVVMPDAHDSAYANMVYGHRYTDLFAQELPAMLSSFFPLSANREDHFLLGCSMGGEGALKLALTHPELYGAVGCLSAGIRNFSDVLENDPRWHERMNLAYGFDRAAWRQEETFEAARRLAASGEPCPRIYHACGDDDFLLESVQETRNFFLGFEGNPFDYTYSQTPGRHGWSFWQEQLAPFIEFALKNGK